MTQGTAFIEQALIEEIDSRTSPTSALATIGGAGPVALVVDEFYRRLLADPQVAPVFQSLIETGGMAHLKRHQVLMLVRVLGGPDQYTGRDLATAHRGLGITDPLYRRVSLYLLLVMYDSKVPMDILCAADDILRSVHGMVVTPVE